MNKKDTLICNLYRQIIYTETLFPYLLIGNNNNNGNLLALDWGGGKNKRGGQKVLYKSPSFLRQGRELKNTPGQGR